MAKKPTLSLTEQEWFSPVNYLWLISSAEKLPIAKRPGRAAEVSPPRVCLLPAVLAPDARRCASGSRGTRRTGRGRGRDDGGTGRGLPANEEVHRSAARDSRSHRRGGSRGGGKKGERRCTAGLRSGGIRHGRFAS